MTFWTIDAALSCQSIDAVYISTDSSDIRKAVENYDRTELKHKLYCIDRDESTATDSASTESVYFELINKVESERIVLLQATSPLTEAQHLI